MIVDYNSHYVDIMHEISTCANRHYNQVEIGVSCGIIYRRDSSNCLCWFFLVVVFFLKIKNLINLSFF